MVDDYGFQSLTPVAVMPIPLLTGAVLGLSVAAPFGPVALMCFQRSIAAGLGLGIVTGLGAACVQGLYATVAIAGAGEIALYLAVWSHSIKLGASAILIYLGTRVLMRRPPTLQAQPPLRARTAFASSFAVALCNPMTFMPYLLVASGAAATETAEASLTLWSVPGVFVGAATWYSVISSSAALFRSGLPPGAIRMLNQVAGAMLIGFGVMTSWGPSPVVSQPIQPTTIAPGLWSYTLLTAHDIGE